eukprot:scaffold1934_cov79-Cylindrotheca_fusiformis.AAC.8
MLSVISKATGVQSKTKDLIFEEIVHQSCRCNNTAAFGDSLKTFLKLFDTIPDHGLPTLSLRNSTYCIDLGVIRSSAKIVLLLL